MQIARLRDTVEPSVLHFIRTSPNEHLGDLTPREDIRSAFRIIRNRLQHGWSIQSAAGEVDRFAYSMADM